MVCGVGQGVYRWGVPFLRKWHLHCLCGVYKDRLKFRALGELRIADEGFPYWLNAPGVIPLCQLRDNILIASSYPDSPQERIIDTVCRILESSWELAMLCDCCQRQTDTCKFTCHGSTCSALGYSLIRGESGDGTVYAQPSALTMTWDLKLGPLLIAPEQSHPTYLPGILLGVMSNTRHWCNTWAGELLSPTVWLQVVALSGYGKKRILRATHSAVARGLSTSPHDALKTVQYMYDVAHRLPMRCCCALSFSFAWLVKHAHWREGGSTTVGSSLSSCPRTARRGRGQTIGMYSGMWYTIKETAIATNPSRLCLPHSQHVCVCVCVCEQAVTPESIVSSCHTCSM